MEITYGFWILLTFYEFWDILDSRPFSFLFPPQLKIFFLHPLYISFHSRLLNFFNDHYPFLTDVHILVYFMRREPLWPYKRSTFIPFLGLGFLFKLQTSSHIFLHGFNSKSMCTWKITSIWIKLKYKMKKKL